MTESRGTRRARSTKRRLAIVLAAVVVLVASSIGVTARYVMTHDRAAEMIAAGFHVSSDSLTEVASPDAADPALARTAVLDASGNFTVNLYNWEVENVSSVSRVSVTYDIAVDNGTLVSGPSGAYGNPPGSVSGMELGDGSAAVEHTWTVKPTDASLPVAVVVSATAPYRKVLKAVFTASGGGMAASASANLQRAGLSASFTSSATGAALLEIETNHYAGPVTVVWPSGVGIVGGAAQAAGWVVDYGSRTATLSDARKQATYYLELDGVTGSPSASVNGGAINVSVS